VISFLIVLSIVVAVVVGYKTKVNVGLIAIAFSYIFGAFVLHMKTSAIIALWPTSLFFFIMMASFFYGIAVTNGTLGLISEHFIYAFRNHPYLIPIMMWVVCFALSGLGAGPTTIFAFMPAIILGMCDRIKLNKLVAAVCIVGGGVAGGYTPISLCYATVKTCLLNAGYEEAEALAMLPRISFNNILAQVIIFVVIYIICRSWKVESPVYETKPDALSKKQVQTAVIIAIGLVIAVLFPLLKTLFPTVAIISTLSSAIEPSLLFCVLLVISLLMHLGDEKKALAFVPWSTIILVCGAAMLVAVANKAGAIEVLSTWVSDGLSPVMAKIVLAMVGGFMSFFSSTLGVVGPTLIPFVSGISAATGVSATALISSIMVGGHFAGVSPFSTGGGMTMAGETDEVKKNKLFVSLMALSVGSILFASFLTVLGVIS
jgi:di/tricarboxylate transporter